MAIEVKDVDFLEAEITKTIEADGANERKKAAELVWANNCPVKQEEVTALRHYDRNYGLAFQKAHGKALVNMLNEKPDVSYAKARAECDGVEFAIEIARHQDPKATTAQKASGIGMVTRVTVHDTAPAVLTDLAGLLK